MAQTLVVSVGLHNDHGDDARYIGTMAKHPNKHIREAIKYAEQNGWSFTKSRGHLFGMLRCPQPGGCRHPVYSTPRHPEDHAKDIRREVGRCPHGGDG